MLFRADHEFCQSLRHVATIMPARHAHNAASAMASACQAPVGVGVGPAWLSRFCPIPKAHLVPLPLQLRLQNDKLPLIQLN